MMKNDSLGFQSMLESYPGTCEHIQRFHGQAAIAQVQSFLPDIAFLDIHAAHERAGSPGNLLQAISLPRNGLFSHGYAD